MSQMARRSLVIWLLMLIVASVNGAIREALLIPTIGDIAGRAVSTIMLCALVLLLASLTIGWIHPRSPVRRSPSAASGSH
jgi:hypothetical protein